jgi:predicted nucleic acid-binding protein
MTSKKSPVTRAMHSLDVKYSLLRVVADELAEERVRKAYPARGNRVVKELYFVFLASRLSSPQEMIQLVQSKLTSTPLSGSHMSRICLPRPSEKF